MVQFVAKIFLASGFLLGIYGLTEQSPILFRSGLGLVAASMIAAGYHIYRTVRSRSDEGDQ